MNARRTCAPVAGNFLLLAWPTRTPAQTPPTIAAAANLNFALNEIADAFARARNTHVELVFGASGTLTRQIRDGAPFEMFLAADEEFPNQLTAAGLTRDAGAVYAVGRLVLFAPKGSPLTVDEKLEGLARLAKAGGVSRFAIANPDVAPYGKAAEAVLRKRGLWDTIRPRLVLGDTIAQAAQFATTGNAVGGLIAYSLVLAPDFGDRGTYAVIPDADYPPLRQRMVLLKRREADRGTVLRLRPQRRGARDPPEARVRGATIATHGLVGPSCLAVAGSGHDRRPAPVRNLVWAPARVPQFPRQAARRSPGHRAAGAPANRARVLPACHLWRPVAARSSLPSRRRAVAAILLRGAAVRLRDREHSLRRSTDSARLRSDSRRTSAMPLPAAA